MPRLRIGWSIVPVLLAAGASSAAWSAPVSAQGKKILADLAQGSVAEVQMGEMAQQQSQNPAVQDFGKRMVEDHTILLQNAQKEAASLGIQLPSGMTAKDLSTQKSLQGTTGPQFDQKYIQANLTDHKNDIRTLQRFIEAHPNSPIKPLVEKTLPILENHMRVAENVAGKVGVSSELGLNTPVHPEPMAG